MVRIDLNVDQPHHHVEFGLYLSDNIPRNG